MKGELEAVSTAKGRVVVVPTVQGLVSEADAVKRAVAREAPDAVALNVSPESLVGLRKARDEPPVPIGITSEEEAYDAEDALSDAEIGYGVALESYGRVRLPPPCLMEAVRWADDAEKPVFGVDLSDAQYEGVFLEHVGFMSLWRYGRRAKKLAQKPPLGGTAREFAVAWDRELASVGGYGRVEEAREAQMAQGAARLADRFGTVLLVVDVARSGGVLERLRQASD